MIIRGNKQLRLATLHGASVAPAGPTLLISDTFTDADTTSLDAHTIAPTNVPATAWTEVGSTAWAISGNKCAPISNISLSHATVNAGVANCTITLKAKSTTTNTSITSNGGIVARWTDANNYWMITINAQTDMFYIIERNGGVVTSRAEIAVTIDTTTEYAIVATLDGTTITATLDGANQISYGSATLNQTATVHGIYGPRGNDRFDDFTVTTL